MALHVILGAGGAVSNSLTKTLLAAGERVRLFSRSAKPVAGAESVGGDILDAAAVHATVAGADIVYLTVGLPYRIKVWRRDWPVVMDNAIAACKAAGAKLMFFDNVYAYGPVDGVMTEDTPYNPTSKKGKVRAQIVQRLQAEMASKALQGMVVRAADFYGPGAEGVSVLSYTVFGNIKSGKQPQALCSAAQPHSYNYAADFGPAMWALAQRPDAWGQVWHLPVPPQDMTTQQMADLAAAAVGKPKPKLQIASKPIVWVLGLFNPLMGEIYEMLYQYDRPYHFSSAKFDAAFGSMATPYAEGIKASMQ